MTAIWSGDLRRTIRRSRIRHAQRRASTTLTRRLNTSSPSPTPLTCASMSRVAVVVDDRHGLLFVELEPAVDRFLGVVVALHDASAARVAGPVDLGRKVHVVHALAALAHAPAGEPVEHDVAGHVEVDREVERATVENAVELLRLMQRARESVEDEAVAERAAGREALLDHADHDLVGNELAAVHVALGLEPERGALLRLRAEELSRGEMGDAEVLAEARRLSPFAGALLAEQNQARLRRGRAQLRNPS